MKKAVRLMVMCLMAIFIFSPSPISANDNVDVPDIDIYVTPKPLPFVVSYSESIVLDWKIHRITEEKVNYFIEIYEYNKPERVYEKLSFTMSEGQRDVKDSRELSISRDKFPIIGQYEVKIECPGVGKESKYFKVGEGGKLVVNKFYDVNMNGKKDINERSLSGWDFTLIYKDNPEEAMSPTGTTGADGTYTWIDLAGGNYTIIETLKKCWNTTSKSKEVTVKEGEITTADFGNYEVGTLKITKYNDTNNNSKIDSADKKLPGWEFQVTYPDGKTSNNITDGNGEIKIDVPFGTYTVKEQLKKDGWIAITPSEQTKNVKQCEETLEFLNRFNQRRLVITKYYDHNMNGERDSGEEGIGNWEFEIKYPDGRIETVFTDPDGIYERIDPPPGKYTITEQPQRCWKESTPTVRHDVEITPDRGAEVEFGNFEMGTLTIYKFNDTDHNGVWDDGELPLPNWEFKVKGPNGVIDITRYTDDKGRLSVELPANFRYSVSETIPVGWRNSTPYTQSVHINPCEDTPAIFGNYRHIPINIYKFNDTNGDGIRDSGEEGLAGWDFWVHGPNVNKIFTTDANGRVIYRDAISGQYRIEERPREDQRNLWRSTTALVREVTVEDREPKPEEFGNKFKGTLCEEYGLYNKPSIEWYPMSDGYLNVSKHLEPHIVHCDSPNLQNGEIINVTLKVCAFAGMSPTDLVIAVDTSGSLIERGGVVLEVIRDGIIAFMNTNKAKFAETGRVGLVSWDEDIDETVNLTTDYSKVTAACRRLSSNAEEDTLYQVGLNGSIDVFARSPRGNAKKVIVFITDAKGTTDGLASYSQLLDTSGCVIHAITVGTERDNGTVKMLQTFTSQHSGFVKSVPESSDELAKQLTSLTVTNIERRTLNNVTVIETLPKYLRALDDSYTLPPTSVQINPDGIDWSTETIVWDIGDLTSDNCWESTFKALFCCQMPADETHPIGIPKNTSEVRYTDPTNSSITRHLPIPEGIIWIRAGPQPSGFEALLALAGILAVAYLMWKRRR
jgi:hypothetical protein